jgi:hypothetical protein
MAKKMQEGGLDVEKKSSGSSSYPSNSSTSTQTGSSSSSSRSDSRSASSSNSSQASSSCHSSSSGTAALPEAIAEEFNNFFSSIDSQIASTIPPSTTDPLSYIPDNPNVPQLSLNHTGPSQIIDLLKSFDNKPTPDLDGISKKLLRFVSHEIAVPLARIYNLSISLGVFPDKFKTARIVPVYKTGDISSCDNYRPIALVKSFSKILEK